MRREVTRGGKGGGGRRRRRGRRLLWTALFLAVLLLLSLAVPLPPGMLDPGRTISLRIEDRRGRLLREVLSDQEGRATWLRLEEMAPDVITATLAAEDRRFFRHFGVDPLAIVRAVGQNIAAGRVVSGGSTITQQLAKVLEPRPRTLWGKVLEAWLALRLELRLSKREILEQYLNRVCYGNQAFGIEAATRLYFGKPAGHLSLAEAAFLAVLPRAPTRMDPYRHGGRARAAQRRLLKLMLERGDAPRELVRRALVEPLKLVPARRNFRAPHFCDWILSRAATLGLPRVGTLRTTLDLELQEEVQRRLAAHVERFATAELTQAACMVLSQDSGEILALVGSRDFFDAAHDGQVNGALALRQPGSSLKPFLYGLALESGAATAATVIPDIELHLRPEGGDFRPLNYDRRYHGPVRLRQALACSYNVPAVRLTEQLGVPSLLETLRRAGFAHLEEPPVHYGTGLALGNGEVQLVESVAAYAALARGGEWRPPVALRGIRDARGRELPLPSAPAAHRLFSRETSFLIADILADPMARAPAFGRDGPLELPFWCAVKTGTTKDYRDCWTVGFTDRYCVGVWAGNFDNRPTRGVSGSAGAAPLFRDVMELLHGRGSEPRPPVPPPGLERREVCLLSGGSPGPECPGARLEWLPVGTELPPCRWHVRLSVDRRNGLLAGPGCPPGEVEERLFLDLPPEYLHWAMASGLALPPREESPLCGEAVAGEPSPEPRVGERPEIRFPDQGDIFKLDPVLRPEFQTLTFRAVLPRETQEAVWILDDATLAVVRVPPFDASWQLSPGRHTVRVIARRPGGESASEPVQFRVLP